MLLSSNFANQDRELSIWIAACQIRVRAFLLAYRPREAGTIHLRCVVMRRAVPLQRGHNRGMAETPEGVGRKI